MIIMKHLNKKSNYLIWVIFVSSLAAQDYQQDNFILKLEQGVNVYIQEVDEEDDFQ